MSHFTTHELLFSTTGTVSPVSFPDLGSRDYAHPTVDHDIAAEFSFWAVIESDDFRNSLDAGEITVKASDGTVITSWADIEGVFEATTALSGYMSPEDKQDLIDASNSIPNYYGEISVHDNHTPETAVPVTQTLTNDLEFYEVTAFDTNGPAFGTIPDFTTNSIEIVHDGTYLVSYSASFSGNAAQEEYEVSLGVDGAHVHVADSERKLGGSGDVGNMGGTGLVALTAGQLISLQVMCRTVSGSIIQIHQAALNVVRTNEGAIPTVTGANHNLLTGLQGGIPSERYHLTAAEKASVSAGKITVLHFYSYNDVPIRTTGTNVLAGRVIWDNTRFTGSSERRVWYVPYADGGTSGEARVYIVTISGGAVSAVGGPLGSDSFTDADDGTIRSFTITDPGADQILQFTITRTGGSGQNQVGVNNSQLVIT